MRDPLGTMPSGAPALAERETLLCCTLEHFDLKSMGYNSARYIHTLYQAMNLAYADRDFYYGDPTFLRPNRSAGCFPRNTRASGRSSSTGP